MSGQSHQALTPGPYIGLTPSEQVAQVVRGHGQHQGRHPQQPAAWEGPVRVAREDVEAFCGVGDRLGRQCAGTPGQRHAVPGEKLRWQIAARTR